MFEVLGKILAVDSWPKIFAVDSWPYPKVLCSIIFVLTSNDIIARNGKILSVHEYCVVTFKWVQGFLT